MLADGESDLVISDHNPPQFSAPKALRLVQERAPDLPFIIVFGTIGEDRDALPLMANVDRVPEAI